MFFPEGCKIVGQLDQDLIDRARDFAMTIDYKEKRYSREEPALKYGNSMISLSPPYVDSSAYDQDNSDLDLSSIGDILNVLKSWPQFSNSTLFSCEVSYLDIGCELKLHNDVRFYHLCGRRIQVPLLVENSYFVSRERPFKLETPYVYEIDNITPHYAKNLSATTPKVSLLIDFVDAALLAEERAIKRHPRRRVLYYFNTTPDTDKYGIKTVGKIQT